VAVDDNLKAMLGDRIVNARGAALLPGLHDHHMHLVALAAALKSLRCGPPHINSQNELIAALSRISSAQTGSWVRGIAYHPSVAGDIDRHWLDKHIPNQPIRIQHRGGRLWVLNTLALSELNITSPSNAPPGLERIDGSYTGRLYEEDLWLRSQLKSQLPSLADASRLLSTYGVTGITDTTPGNSSTEWEYFRDSQRRGDLNQNVRMMGTLALNECKNTPSLERGEYKIHLLESQLPDFEQMCSYAKTAHDSDRSIAIHCVTLTELVFALSVLETVGVRTGDRIEHASVTPPLQLQKIRALGLRVVTQPHFIAERGDQYLRDVTPTDQPWLYRVNDFIEAGVPIAGGSDAPFGGSDPWLAMQAAVKRKTISGTVMNAQEALSPEQALELFLSASETPGLGRKTVAQGLQASLCLLDVSWQQARQTLCSSHVTKTWYNGSLIYDRVN
jgi:predicted amidohydrolase YtcJ